MAPNDTPSSIHTLSEGKDPISNRYIASVVDVICGPRKDSRALTSILLTGSFSLLLYFNAAHYHVREADMPRN